MAEPDLDRRIAAIRRFNRLYTQRIGVLDEGYLATPFSLAESRVLYELAHSESATAARIADQLNLDPGYLSRILRGFRRRGLVDRQPAPTDRRQTLLSLTAAGRAAFAPLDAGARAAIGRLLDPLTPVQQRALTEAMAEIGALLGSEPAARPAAYTLRSHRPGDLGWVVARHGAVYAEEYGWDAEFEAMVAEIAAAFLRRFDPHREACWIAESGGRNVGSVALMRHSDDMAQLRVLLVEAAARGFGIGARLVEECIGFARRTGYRHIMLTTYDALTAARRIYEGSGFRCVARRPEHAYGQDLIGETWELAL